VKCLTSRISIPGDDENLKNLLRNPHLRNLLKEVDSASDPASAMKAAMQEPLFLEFADVCLSVVDDVQ
jgi:hypothetical protein